MTATVALLTVMAAQPVTSATPADEWGARADRAIARAIQLDSAGKGTVFNWSYLASAIAKRSPDGWHDPQALEYMHKVLARRHPDGGFGLDYAYDLFGDGTINPAGTAYTVTMTDHVGVMMLEAHKAGVLHRYYIDTLLAKLASMPRVSTPVGYCVAYSDQAADTKPGMCAHNANAGYGAFIQAARAAGFGQASLWLAMDITRYEAWSYRPYDRGWRYWSEAGRLNDADHNAYQVESMYRLAPPIAEAAIAWMNTRTLDATSAEAHTRLAKFDCTGSLRWLGEYDQRTAASSWVWGSLDRMAYLARLTAEAATACN